jgi:hypothetical protein
MLSAASGSIGGSPAASGLSDSNRLRILFGLDERPPGNARDLRALRAMNGLPNLVRAEWENQPNWDGRERRWRSELFSLLAEVILQSDKGQWNLRLLPQPPNFLPFDLDALPRTFVGRASQVEEIRGALRARSVVVTGQPGVGKTTFAVALAYEVQADYADGVIQLDLRGYSPDPELTAVQAFQRVLLRLGHRSEELSLDPDLLRSHYRAVLASRQMLLLFDNVADPDIAFELIPPGLSTVIFTSRRNLPTLVARAGVLEVELETLPELEAVELLTEKLGATRVESQLAAAKSIVRICDGLPLALVIVSSRLAHNRRRLQAVVEELEVSRETVITQGFPDSEFTVAAALDWSFARLPTRLRTSLIGLGNLPVRFITIATAELLGLTRANVERLTNEHLLYEMPGSEVVLIHDAVARYIRSASVRITVQFSEFQPAIPALRKQLNATTSDFVNEVVARRLEEDLSSSDPWPLLPRGEVDESSEQLLIGAVNMLELCKWFYVVGGEVGASMATDDLIILVSTFTYIGEFELACRALDLLFEALKRWARSESQLVDRPSSEVVDNVSMVTESLELHINTFVARAFQIPELDFLADAKNDVFRKQGIPSRPPIEEWRDLFTTTDEDLLIRRGNAMGGTLVELSPTSANYKWLEHMQPLAQYEHEAQSLALLGRHDEAAIRLAGIVSVSHQLAVAAPTIELLWSVEPPLIGFAAFLREAGRTADAITVLRYVQHLYSSRRSFGGYVNIVDRLIEKFRNRAEHDHSASDNES